MKTKFKQFLKCVLFVAVLPFMPLVLLYVTLDFFLDFLGWLIDRIESEIDSL